MANISKEVNIEMLEKLPDGTYKKKNPTTKAELVKETAQKKFVSDAEKAEIAKVKDKSDKTYVDGELNKKETPAGAQAKATKALTDANAHTNNKVKTDVPAGAKFTDTVYTHPSTHPADMIAESTTKRFVSDSEKSNWNSKETPSGAQTKATKALTDANTYTNTKISQIPKVDVSGKADKAYVDNKVKTDVPVGAKFTDTQVSLSNSVTSTSSVVGASSMAVKTAMDKANEAFQSASNGKNKIATAITGKEVPTSSSDSFAKMARNIEEIETLGGRYLSGAVRGGRLNGEIEVVGFPMEDNSIYYVDYRNHNNTPILGSTDFIHEYTMSDVKKVSRQSSLTTNINDYVWSYDIPLDVDGVVDVLSDRVALHKRYNPGKVTYLDLETGRPIRTITISPHQNNKTRSEQIVRVDNNGNFFRVTNKTSDDLRYGAEEFDIEKFDSISGKSVFKRTINRFPNLSSSSDVCRSISFNSQNIPCLSITYGSAMMNPNAGGAMLDTTTGDILWSGYFGQSSYYGTLFAERSHLTVCESKHQMTRMRFNAGTNVLNTVGSVSYREIASDGLRQSEYITTHSSNSNLDLKFLDTTTLSQADVDKANLTDPRFKLNRQSDNTLMLSNGAVIRSAYDSSNSSNRRYGIRFMYLYGLYKKM